MTSSLWFLVTFVLTSSINDVSGVSQMSNLLWTEKETSDGVVNIKGIPGDPSEWVPNGSGMYAISYFSDDYSRQISHRVALGFRYSGHDLLFTDRGFKNLYRIVLQVATSFPYSYWVPLNTVYSGTSTQVNGMAVDWASGSVYWTDALYNWITVANMTSRNIYNHIVDTGLDRPMGIAVYPQEGLLYWSDIGAVCKIERSRLDGTQRENFIDSDLDKPLGLAIDYVNGWLYWVDDFRKTIERVDAMTGLGRHVIRLSDFNIAYPKLFGLAIYKDEYIFAAEQTSMTIMIFNKTAETYIKEINAAIFANTSAIPYDVIMYDGSLQEDIDSDCARLQCQDICISDGDGGRAHCMCRTGYTLNKTDNVTCYKSALFAKPQYIYSVGEQICGTPVQISDSSKDQAPSFVYCFYTLPGHTIRALAFHVYADLLFFSADNDHFIHRLHVETNDHLQIVAANTGLVDGLAVDWIADNLYWTSEDRGYIVVSRLDGRFPKILVDGLVRPKSIAVNPLTGTMYWVSLDKVYAANMDGTNIRIFLQMPNATFDGTVLDIRRDRLYIVDSSLPGVVSIHQNGTGLQVTIQAVNRTFHDVTVYQTYMAWTDGANAILFGVTNDNSSITSVLRGIIHVFLNTSHDIITFDEYLQPQLEPGRINPCDIDDDKYGCKHLCLLAPGNQRRCNCSVGYHLDTDGRSCVSERLLNKFLLFVDPYAKTMYQVSLSDGDDAAGPRQIHAIALRTSNQPIRAAYGQVTQYLYWHDEDTLKNSIKLTPMNSPGMENSISVLSNEYDVGELEAVSTMKQLVYTEVTSKQLRLLNPNSESEIVLSAAVNVVPTSLAVNQITGDIYWIEAEQHDNYTSLNQTIYTCKAANCINRQRAKRVLSWNQNAIVGLSVALNEESNLVFWTQHEVYLIDQESDQSAGNSVEEQLPQSLPAKSILHLTDSSNITGAVVVDNLLYFTDWSQNSIFKVDLSHGSDQTIVPITDPVFSRLLDLKAYRISELSRPSVFPDTQTTSPPPVLSRAAIGGIIGGGIGALLLLLLLVILLIALLRRRRRQRDPSFKTSAHDNPTYMTHQEVNAAVGSPIDAGHLGAVGYAFQFPDTKDVKEKKEPLEEVEYDFQPPHPRFERLFSVDSTIDFNSNEKKSVPITPTSDAPAGSPPPPPLYGSDGNQAAGGIDPVDPFAALPHYSEIDIANTHL